MLTAFSTSASSRLGPVALGAAAKAAEAEEVAATREAQSAGDYKKASKAEEMLSKELVKANSEWTNRKTAYKSELKALEALKESEAEGGAAEEAIGGESAVLAKSIQMSACELISVPLLRTARLMYTACNRYTTCAVLAQQLLWP
eukprot:21489-Heterococcus_DN1.PRE.1